jgi:hypothetical protein
MEARHRGKCGAGSSNRSNSYPWIDAQSTACTYKKEHPVRQGPMATWPELFYNARWLFGLLEARSDCCGVGCGGKSYPWYSSYHITLDAVKFAM